MAFPVLPDEPFVLYETGVALVGPNPKQLIPPVDIQDVREASREDLRTDWSREAKRPEPFEKSDYDSSHLQAYAILTMCRILHRAKNDDVTSKRIASDWVKKTCGKSWSSLIEKAENWQHGQKLDEREDAQVHGICIQGSRLVFVLTSLETNP